MKQSIISDIQDIKNFVFGGNATVTLESAISGKHFTFKVRVAKKDDDTAPYFVSVLNGPDNYTNYSYLGIISSDKKTFKLTQKSKIGVDALSFKAFNFFFNQIMNDKLNPDLKVYHSGKCGRCGKKLTTPSSIEKGIGPECLKKSLKKSK
jgi:hypothetical protein